MNRRGDGVLGRVGRDREPIDQLGGFVVKETREDFGNRKEKKEEERLRGSGIGGQGGN